MILRKLFKNTKQDDNGASEEQDTSGQPGRCGPTSVRSPVAIQPVTHSPGHSRYTLENTPQKRSESNFDEVFRAHGIEKLLFMHIPVCTKGGCYIFTIS